MDGAVTLFRMSPSVVAWVALAALVAAGCGSSDGAPAEPEPSCSCDELTDACACLDDERLVRLVSLRATPATGEAWSSAAFVLVGAPDTTRALLFDTGDAEVSSLTLGSLGDPDGAEISPAPGRLEPRPDPGWLQVTRADAAAAFELSVHAVAANDDPAFAHERWMEELGDGIGAVALNRLCLVGSHDAASHGINPSSEWASDWQAPELNPRTGVRASRASETAIIQQLLAGVRYLDLRVDADDDGELWMVHGLRGERLSSVARDLELYLANHPRELLVLDLQHVSGQAADRHQRVLEALGPALTGRMVDPNAVTPTSTLAEVWARGEQALVLMSDAPDALFLDNPIWRRGDRLESLWGNVQDVTALKTHLDTVVAVPPAEKLFVLQAVLTPDDAMAVAWGIQPDAATVDVRCADDTIDIGLCALARQTTPLVHGWVTGEWQSAALNIIMVDYPSLAPLVEACIARLGG